MGIVEICEKYLIFNIHFPHNEKIMARFPLVFVHADIIILIFVCLLYSFFGGVLYTPSGIICIIIVCIFESKKPLHS